MDGSWIQRLVNIVDKCSPVTGYPLRIVIRVSEAAQVHSRSNTAMRVETRCSEGREREEVKYKG